MEKEIKQIVIYGHKLHSHTHSYIHYGFKKAFEHLGYKTLWLDKKDYIANIDFTNSLFVTEGQVDTNIPIRVDSYYVLHNCNMEKYNSIPYENKLMLQVYTNSIIDKAIQIPDTKYCFYQENCLFMPWATDLLPYEIDKNIELVNSDKIKRKNVIYFIGMHNEYYNKIINICFKKRIEYREFGGFKKNVESEDNMKMIQESLIALSIQSDWQVNNGYIPCRIFKNISYGRMGLTNNKTVYNLFDNKIIYRSDISQLFKAGIMFERNSENKNISIIPLMEDVKFNHTYLNRIKTIFWMFQKIAL